MRTNVSLTEEGGGGREQGARRPTHPRRSQKLRTSLITAGDRWTPLYHNLVFGGRSGAPQLDGLSLGVNKKNRSLLSEKKH